MSEEYENPAIEPFAQSVLRGMPQIQGRKALSELANMTCNYICDVVALELSKTPSTLGHLQCLVDAARDQQVEGCDIFTLNHDTLIERVFDSEGLSRVDGFGEQERDVAWWDAARLNRPSRHYFLKLHGSIDWVPYDGRLAKTLGADRNYAHTSDGKLLPVPGRARMLVGTFNKIRDYFKEPYFDVLATLRRQTERIGCLIVSGYSFGDKGINAVLTEWMRPSTQRLLLVLHAGGHQCIDNARGAIQGLWERNQGKRMQIHPNHLNQCDWGELRRKYKIA